MSSCIVEHELQLYPYNYSSPSYLSLPPLSSPPHSLSPLSLSLFPSPSPSLPFLPLSTHTDSNQWCNIASMSTRRSSVGVAILNGCVYAVGGYDGVARQCLNSVERYDPVADEWVLVEPMHQRRSGAAVAVLENFLYAIGGHDGPDIRKSVER